MDERLHLLPRLWADLGGDPSLLDAVTSTGPDTVLGSCFDVTGFAAATVAAADLAVAELVAARSGGAPASVVVDRRQACAAFVCERLLRAEGWTLPPVWDPLAGDYRTADGWIRLHTNYGYHRAAVLRALGLDGGADGSGAEGSGVDAAAVAAAVAGWDGAELEAAVVAEGGCAAQLMDAATWRSHPAGRASADEPAVALRPVGGGTAGPLPAWQTGDAPLAGVRVLDLTRVIAGPVATRFLAAHGADVVRIDPPGFEEVALLLPETTRGKRCAALDLRSDADRATFERLVAEADVVVDGLRADALPGLGYDAEALRALRPGLIVVSHDAYGWSGPWAGRRGFDSLVQMSTGIAAAGAAATGSPDGKPVPLPAQALDHGTGFLLAAAVCRALSERVGGVGAVDGAASGRTVEARGSLVGAANVLMSAPTPDGLAHPAPVWTDADTEAVASQWGPLRQAPVPGGVSGHPPRLRADRPAGPLGAQPAAFDPRTASTSSASTSSATA